MERRAFLIRGGTVLLVLPAAWSAACGGDGSSSNELRFTSSSVQGHTHDFTLQMSEVTAPGASGISRDTSSSAGHTHIVTLSQAELMQVNAGQSVNKETSVTSGHSHTFVFSRATAKTSGSGGSSGGGY